MIPIFGQKKLDELTESDLYKLKDNKIRESRFIEYKKRGYDTSNSKEATEMLADITAFANADGGYLLIGIDEESKKNPIPRAINGIADSQVEYKAYK
jgi:predicted HTH transcriptional regulator